MMSSQFLLVLEPEKSAETWMFVGDIPMKTNGCLFVPDRKLEKVRFLTTQMGVPLRYLRHGPLQRSYKSPMLVIRE